MNSNNNKEIEYYYLVREAEGQEIKSEQEFNDPDIREARQQAMRLYKQILLKTAKETKLKWNEVNPVSVYLVESVRGESEYYPIVGRVPHEMETAHEVENRVLQELNPSNAFFE